MFVPPILSVAFHVVCCKRDRDGCRLWNDTIPFNGAASLLSTILGGVRWVPALPFLMYPSTNSALDRDVYHATDLG